MAGRAEKSCGPKQLAFVDETWASTNMTPLYGRTPKGKRVDGAAPHGHWLTTTLVAALRHDRIDAPEAIESRGATLIYLLPYSSDMFQSSGCSPS